jgi:dUTP pyrophosphatase
MKIPVQATEASSRIPAYAHPGDAGADLAASEATVIDPGGRALVGTGLVLAIPEGHAGLVIPRSGLAIRSGVTVLNAPGLIDAGYRGEVKVALINHSDEPFTIAPGDRIAQLVVVRVEAVTFEEVDDVETTSRGDGGFGSTGIESS